MPVVQDLAEMYKAVDGAATINLLAKLAVEKSYHAKLDDTRSSLAVSSCHLTCNPKSQQYITARAAPCAVRGGKQMSKQSSKVCTDSRDTAPVGQHVYILVVIQHG